MFQKHFYSNFSTICVSQIGGGPCEGFPKKTKLFITENLCKCSPKHSLNKLTCCSEEQTVEKPLLQNAFKSSILGGNGQSQNYRQTKSLTDLIKPTAIRFYTTTVPKQIKPTFGFLGEKKKPQGLSGLMNMTIIIKWKLSSRNAKTVQFSLVN